MGQQGLPVIQQMAEAQATGEDEREKSAAKNDGNDWPLGQKAGRQQQRCCSQPVKASSIEPRQKRPEGGAGKRGDGNVEHQATAFAGDSEAAEQNQSGDPAAFGFARETACNAGCRDDQQCAKKNADQPRAEQ